MKISDISWSGKLKVKEDNIQTMYSMTPYKSKVMHIEDDILNLSLNIQNKNYYHRKYNYCGDDSSMDHMYDKHLGDTIVSGNKDLRGNRMMESRGLVLSYLHIDIHTGDAKYRV